MIDAAHIVDTNWDRATPLNRDRLIQLLAGISLTFDRDLDPDRSRAFTSFLVWVRFLGFDRVTPPLLIPGIAVARGNIVRWRPRMTPPELLQSGLQLQSAGQLQIDLHADYLFDTTGLPASHSASALAGGQGPFLPGGILRLFILHAG